MEPARELSDGLRCKECSLLFGPKLTKAQMLYTCAQMLLSQNNLVTMEDTGEVLAYERGVYQRDVASVLMKDALHTLQEKANNLGRSEILGYIKTETTVDRQSFDDFGEGIINVKNGLLDLTTLNLMPHSPKHYSVNQLPVNYDPEAQCPLWLEFLSEVLATEEERLTLQEFFGYIFFDGYPIHKALMMLGSGRNGKGTVMRVMAALVGSENCASLSIQQLEERFLASSLWGKMVNLGGDIPSTKLRDTSRFKGLTGGDIVKCDVKHRQSIDLRNRAKMVFSANKIPQTEDDEAAFFSRWLILEFLRSFEGEEDIHLTEKLTSPEELSGVLNWAAEGYQRLKKNNTFTLKRTAQENSELWEDYVEAPQGVGDFIDECLVSCQSGGAKKNDIRVNYIRYCEKWNYKANESGLWRTIRRRGYRETKTQERPEKKRVRRIRNLGFVEDIEEKLKPLTI
jgi:putative DNA primase/helicase